MNIPHPWITRWYIFLKAHPSLQTDLIKTLMDFDFHPDAEADDEEYWRKVQTLFPQPDGHFNLNHGGVSSQAVCVEQAYLHYYTLLNSSPSYYTWKVMEFVRTEIRNGLGIVMNADPSCIALLRNATEALNNAIFGIPLKAGDEVVACRQDYIKCVSSWKQREEREGIQIRWVDLKGTESNEEVIERYTEAFTPLTKVLHLTHVINWNGMILPVKEIIAEAHRRNIKVILDGAHSLGMLPVDIQELDCDYFGAALHKWLGGPVAAGVLYVKKEYIAETYALASALDPHSEAIQKFEEMSIQVMPNWMALGFAIVLHLSLSREAKERRLRYLCRLWVNAIKDLPGIVITAPLHDDQFAAFTAFRLEGMQPEETERILFEKSRLHTVGFNWPNLDGVRITPNIYTPVEHLYQLTEGIRSLIFKTVPHE